MLYRFSRLKRELWSCIMRGGYQNYVGERPQYQKNQKSEIIYSTLGSLEVGIFIVLHRNSVSLWFLGFK